jgi:hypothetical protein
MRIATVINASAGGLVGRAEASAFVAGEAASSPPQGAGA